MGKLGCTINGTVDDSKFNEPMPWIGIYVVAASAACAIAMFLDTFHGFRYRKLWFPSKFFALNATTLTLIGVAVKLSLDLNTSMPRQHEQLAKLSSTTFICTAIGNSMPSLGTMETKELMMNVVALAIIVITVIVNICIQLGTRVIYAFWIEHAVVMFFMLILLAIMISSSLAIPAAKTYLDLKYKKKFEVVKKECDHNYNCNNASVTEKLRDDLMRYWMMAHTCNPQFVMGHIATCTASGAFCLLSAFTLAEAMLRSYLMPWSFTFCKGESDYKWSTILILVTQAIAVVGGTIAPACRYFIAIKHRCPKKTAKSIKGGFASVENYWLQNLYHVKECPVELRIYSQHGRKLIHNTKNKALGFCISIQKSLVVSSKIVRLISILSVFQLMTFHRFCDKLFSLVKCKNSMNRDAESELMNNCKLDLSQYVLHLEGDEALIDVMMKCDRDATGHWIKMGRKKQPTYLLKLLEKLTRGFEGVQRFDSREIPSLDSEEPPNSWALPVVTLTSIAVAISNIDLHETKELMKCVREGFKYIRVIENSLDIIKKDVIIVRKAADIVWVGVDLHYRWLDVDLRNMAVSGKSPSDIISELSNIAKHRFIELRNHDVFGCASYSSSKWPINVLAANSMYRICRTLLLQPGNRSNECREVIFERLTVMIADIIGACCTNLQHAISMICHQSTIEQREERVRSAILLLGETEKVLEILSRQTLPSSDLGKTACINEWRATSRDKDQLLCSSSQTTSDSGSSSSPDLHLSID